MNRAEKEIFLLVHAAWLGGWAWEPVANLLRQEGHEVVAPDLPGHGENIQNPQDITLDAYVEAVTQAIDQTTTSVTLVGHSFGGVTVSQAAEHRADRITRLIYVSAFLLPNGVSFQQACQNVQESDVLNNLVLSEDKTTVTIKKDALHHAVAHDVPLEKFQAALPNMVAEPTGPLGSPVAITPERWGNIPRYYVECTEDRAVPIAVQRSMHQTTGVKKVYTLKSSHSPMFSCPDQLANILLDIGKE